MMSQSLPDLRKSIFSKRGNGGYDNIALNQRFAVKLSTEKMSTSIVFDLLQV